MIVKTVKVYRVLVTRGGISKTSAMKEDKVNTKAVIAKVRHGNNVIIDS